MRQMSKSVHAKNNVEEPPVGALHTERIHVSSMRKMVPHKIRV